MRYIFDISDTGGKNVKLTWDLEGENLKDYVDFLVSEGQIEQYDNSDRGVLWQKDARMGMAANGFCPPTAGLQRNQWCTLCFLPQQRFSLSGAEHMKIGRAHV